MPLNQVQRDQAKILWVDIGAGRRKLSDLPEPELALLTTWLNEIEGPAAGQAIEAPAPAGKLDLAGALAALGRGAAGGMSLGLTDRLGIVKGLPQADVPAEKLLEGVARFAGYGVPYAGALRGAAGLAKLLPFLAKGAPVAQQAWRIGGVPIFPGFKQLPGTVPGAIQHGLAGAGVGGLESAIAGESPEDTLRRALQTGALGAAFGQWAGRGAARRPVPAGAPSVPAVAATGPMPTLPSLEGISPKRGVSAQELKALARELQARQQQLGLAEARANLPRTEQGELGLEGGAAAAKPKPKPKGPGPRGKKQEELEDLLMDITEGMGKPAQRSRAPRIPAKEIAELQQEGRGEAQFARTQLEKLVLKLKSAAEQKTPQEIVSAGEARMQKMVERPRAGGPMPPAGIPSQRELYGEPGDLAKSLMRLKRKDLDELLARGEHKMEVEAELARRAAKAEAKGQVRRPVGEVPKAPEPKPVPKPEPPPVPVRKEAPAESNLMRLKRADLDKMLASGEGDAAAIRAEIERRTAKASEKGQTRRGIGAERTANQPQKLGPQPAVEAVAKPEEPWMKPGTPIEVYSKVGNQTKNEWNRGVIASVNPTKNEVVFDMGGKGRQGQAPSGAENVLLPMKIVWDNGNPNRMFRLPKGTVPKREVGAASPKNIKKRIAIEKEGLSRKQFAKVEAGRAEAVGAPVESFKLSPEQLEAWRLDTGSKGVPSKEEFEAWSAKQGLGKVADSFAGKPKAAPKYSVEQKRDTAADLTDAQLSHIYAKGTFAKLLELFGLKAEGSREQIIEAFKKAAATWKAGRQKAIPEAEI